MMKGKPIFSSMEIGRIFIHPKISKSWIKEFSSIAWQIKGENLISQDGLDIIMRSHPISLVGIKRKMYCISGFRSYQLAKSIFPGEHLVPVFVYPEQRDEEALNQVEKLMAADLLLSTLSFGLNGVAWEKDLAHIWDLVPRDLREKIIPVIKSKSKLSEAAGFKQRNLYSNSKPRSSKLRRKLGQER